MPRKKHGTSYVRRKYHSYLVAERRAAKRWARNTSTQHENTENTVDENMIVFDQLLEEASVDVPPGEDDTVDTADRVLAEQKDGPQLLQITHISHSGGFIELLNNENDLQKQVEQQMETHPRYEMIKQVETQHTHTMGDIDLIEPGLGAGDYVRHGRVTVENIVPDKSLRNENFVLASNAMVKEENPSHGESDIRNNCNPVNDVMVSSDGAFGRVSNMNCVPVISALNNNLVDTDGPMLESFLPVIDTAAQNYIPKVREIPQISAAVDDDRAKDKELCPREIKIILDRVSADNMPSHSRKRSASGNTALTNSRQKKASPGFAPPLPLKSVDTSSFQSLVRGVEARGFSLMQTEKDIHFIQLYRTDTPSVKLSVCIDEDFNCSIYVHRQPVDRSHSVWRGLPDKFDDASSVMELLDRINKLTVCCGSLRESYHELVHIGGFLTNKSNTDTVTIVGYREGDFGAVTPDGHPYSSTIRSTKCALFIDRDANSVSVRCKECGKLNHNVRRRCKVLQEQKKKSMNFVPSSVKQKDMAREELFKIMDELRAEINFLESSLNRLEIQYVKAIKCLRDGTRLQSNNQEALSDQDEDAGTSTAIPESSSKCHRS